MPRSSAAARLQAAMRIHREIAAGRYPNATGLAGLLGVSAKIIRKAETLAENPRPSGARKLKGEEDLYRIRPGGYRVVYRIKDRVITVTIIRVRHRRDIYRKF